MRSAYFTDMAPSLSLPLSRSCLLPWLAFNAQAFVWLDILLVGAAFVAANSGNTKLMLSSFGLHSVAALTVRDHRAIWLKYET